MIRAVVDTSILVRAAIKPTGSVGPVLQRLAQAEYTLVYTESLLEELLDVMARPRIRYKYGLGEEDIEAILSLILLRGEPVFPNRHIRACRDPADDMFLEAAGADVIVSGDKDLLALDPFEGIPILGATEFLSTLDRASDRERR
ncbi:MAG: putative toxin-antitoxin system toxin component, PIN family [Deltaproteobacteria bacterium]|nr:putative toxin-antitoxin system toxin component, PIN family [Deltaproteobacteria bacterium]